jgi:hypothetical protein
VLFFCFAVINFLAIKKEGLEPLFFLFYVYLS